MAEVGSSTQKRPFSESMSADDNDATPHHSLPSTMPSQSQPATQSTPSTSAPAMTAPQPSRIPQNTPAPPSKRRKLTEAEKEQAKLDKEAKQKEKEAKQKEKEQEKAQKEEAARVKREQLEEAKKQREESLRVKRDQAEEKKRQREEEQAKRDEEKARKEEEKAKKERAQKRLHSFFVKPAASAPQSPSTKSPHRAIDFQKHNSRGLSADRDQPVEQPDPPTPSKKPISDYHRKFLSYQAPPTAILAESFAATLSEDDLSSRRKKLDALVDENVDHEVPNATSLLEELKIKRESKPTVSYAVPSVSSIMTKLLETQDQPIDLTSNGQAAIAKEPDGPLQQLATVPMKFLRFHEDVRPAYYGTFSRVQDAKCIQKIARSPFARQMPDTEYDYDSEAEWDEGEEQAEDLSDLDSDEEEVDEDDDMEEFIDDEGAGELQRRLVGGNQEPQSTGLMWEDEGRHLRKAESDKDSSETFSEFKMCVLLEPRPTSIDPFSFAYWAPEPLPAAVEEDPTQGNGLMGPPRIPLGVRPNAANQPINNIKANHRIQNSFNGKPIVPPRLMEAFKREVRGKTKTKIGMVEYMKEVFGSQLKKDQIGNTLDLIAYRSGKRPTDIWVLRDV